VVVIDNYDSFVYNLVQYLGELGASVLVFRNDAIGLAELDRLRPAALVVSPGPGRPEGAGVSMAAIRHLGTAGVPVLGVCLGHQCIAQVFGGKVVPAAELMHGKTSVIRHDGRGCFKGMPDPFVATRYHSLVVEAAGLPECLEATAFSEDGTIMGVRHRSLPIEGVQFHPESVLTEQGHQLLASFLSATAAAPTSSAPAPSSRSARI
jgi:anthranilate synthase component 2